MSSPGESSDFDLHGLVGVRVVDGTPADVAVVRRQLGHPETTLDREPDLTVRFVDRLAPSPLTLVGVGESGYDDDSFYLLQAKGGSTRRTRIPFDRLGPGAELVCERGIPAVPHLLATVNLVLLTRNVLPLHATALEVDGEGILVIPVIMNLSEMDDTDAKRLVDFAAGLVFATRGTIERVTAKVFLLSPPNVSVAAEEKERLSRVASSTRADPGPLATCGDIVRPSRRPGGAAESPTRQVRGYCSTERLVRPRN